MESVTIILSPILEIEQKVGEGDYALTEGTTMEPRSILRMESPGLLRMVAGFIALWILLLLSFSLGHADTSLREGIIKRESLFNGNQAGVNPLNPAPICDTKSVHPTVILSTPPEPEQSCWFSSTNMTRKDCSDFHNQVLAGASVFVAVCAFAVSCIVFVFSRMSAQIDTFRQLRATFFQFRKGGKPDAFRPQTLPCRNSPEYKHMMDYWVYAFDEWFITQKLNPVIHGPLWSSYYCYALKEAANNECMLVALLEAYNSSANSQSPLDCEFTRTVISFCSKEVIDKAVKLADARGIILDPHLGLPDPQQRVP